MANEHQKELAKVIEKYFGADAGYLDISCFDLARTIIDAGWEKPVHGLWQYCGEECFVCSVCHDNTMIDYKYCPECGAKMDGERRTDG